MEERIRQICWETAQRKGSIGSGELKKVLLLLKEGEKEKRQKEYDKQEEKIRKELLELMAEGEEIKGKIEKIEEILNQMEKIGFEEGYLYAIAILEESVGQVLQ